eukprot:15462569-Alexandrium_andersonii.AAC.1
MISTGCHFCRPGQGPHRANDGAARHGSAMAIAFRQPPRSAAISAAPEVAAREGRLSSGRLMRA